MDNLKSKMKRNLSQLDENNKDSSLKDQIAFKMKKEWENE